MENNGNKVCVTESVLCSHLCYLYGFSGFSIYSMGCLKKNNIFNMVFSKKDLCSYTYDSE